MIAEAEAVLDTARRQGVAVITAESCTGGLIVALLTEIPGSSEVVLGGIIAYADTAKMELLGVPAALLAKHGAVSEAVAMAMSEGALIAGRHIVAEDTPVLAVAVTGIAGPGGGSAEKPVGTVHLAVRHSPSGRVEHEQALFTGDRHAVRMLTVQRALRMMRRFQKSS